MLQTRRKLTMLGVLAAVFSGVAATSPAVLAAADDEQAKGPSDADLSWVDQRVEAWQPTPQEMRFDQIGWANDLPQAQRLACDHHRPLFVFTYSGSATEANAIALRRC